MKTISRFAFSLAASLCFPLLALTLISLTSGCGANSDGDQKERIIPYIKDAELCSVYQSTSGERAIMSNIGKSNLQNANFEKSYNRADLDAVLAASNDETYKYGTANGILIYKMPLAVAPDACLFQKNLPAPSDSARQYWLDNLMPRDEESGVVDGVFMRGEAIVKNTKTVIIRETAGRWTLVHELMHVNFWSTRTAQKGSDLVVYYSLDANDRAVSSALDAYKADPSEATLLVAAEKVYARAQLTYDALVQGSFEEMADEGLLLDEWAAGRLKQVSRGSVANASWYINYSKTRANDDLTAVGTINGILKSVATSSSYYQVLAATLKTEAFVAGVNANLIELAAKAELQTAALRPPKKTNALVSIDKAVMALTNSHVASMSETPELQKLRKGNAEILSKVGAL